MLQHRIVTSYAAKPRFMLRFIQDAKRKDLFQRKGAETQRAQREYQLCSLDEAKRLNSMGSNLNSLWLARRAEHREAFCKSSSSP